MARAVNGLPALCTCMAPREIRVFPVPHSAMTLAVRACCHLFANPMMASDCAGNGWRKSVLRRCEGASATW